MPPGQKASRSRGPVSQNQDVSLRLVPGTGPIEALPSERLTRTYVIQGTERSGGRALFSAVEHLSYHTGQITFAVKHLKDVDVGYFAGMDLNQQNRPIV